MDLNEFEVSISDTIMSGSNKLDTFEESICKQCIQCAGRKISGTKWCLICGGSGLSRTYLSADYLYPSSSLYNEPPCLEQAHWEAHAREWDAADE